jgi:aryl-alcohol dehydrogenase-like predicted oxidoreductase
MADNPPASSTGLSGCATLQGTEHYAERFEELHPGHFRLCHGLFFSSIGLGTYLGESTDEVDEQYKESVITAVSLGCNVIDTAINYRFQRSERAIGRALTDLAARGFKREELVICTKGGFIPFDGNYPADPWKWVEETLLDKGIVTPDEIHPSGHCMAPMYLYNQLQQSLKNLNVDKIDVYYVHNPETQMSELNEDRFYEALEMAFRALENAVQNNLITTYGIATWNAFLEEREGGHLMQLERVVETARRAAGERHHFRMVEMPVNLAMTDALSQPNQKVGDRKMTLMEAAAALNVCVVGSASLLQGGLATNLPITLQQAITGLPNDAARALHFARSIPGMTTALVGMSSAEHVRANLDLAHTSPMPEQEFNILFGER